MRNSIATFVLNEAIEGVGRMIVGSAFQSEILRGKYIHFKVWILVIVCSTNDGLKIRAIRVRFWCYSRKVPLICFRTFYGRFTGIARTLIVSFGIGLGSSQLDLVDPIPQLQQCELNTVGTTILYGLTTDECSIRSIHPCMQRTEIATVWSSMSIHYTKV